MVATGPDGIEHVAESAPSWARRTTCRRSRRRARWIRATSTARRGALPPPLGQDTSLGRRDVDPPPGGHLHRAGPPPSGDRPLGAGAGLADPRARRVDRSGRPLRVGRRNGARHRLPGRRAAHRAARDRRARHGARAEDTHALVTGRHVDGAAGDPCVGAAPRGAPVGAALGVAPVDGDPGGRRRGGRGGGGDGRGGLGARARPRLERRGRDGARAADRAGAPAGEPRRVARGSILLAVVLGSRSSAASVSGVRGRARRRRIRWPTSSRRPRRPRRPRPPRRERTPRAATGCGCSRKTCATSRWTGETCRSRRRATWR